MRIGADYYPEHWLRERWETDACLMQQAGLNMTRLAEFSWAKLEPEEGKYDLDWLEEAVNVLGKHGISSILCTPTPTMPKWLYDNYPEVVSKDKEGHPLPFGNRQNNCFSNKTYRYFSRKITRVLAERFSNHPCVIGWQLDNELWGPNCYCANCESEFRQALKNKFCTVEALNEAYGTIFWSQSYGDFKDVHLPRHIHSNPSLMLDYQRFHSDLMISFAKEQAEILREICPKHFITHNCMGFALNVDYYELSKLLDFVSFDYYYNTPWAERFHAYMYGAASLDFMRSCKSKNFMIMENSAGATGWETYSRNLHAGELRRMTFQNVAHGADGQMWFRWRTCCYGTEQYWHGLLGHDGVPGRRYEEAKRTAQDLQKIWTELEGSIVKSEVAIVLTYSDRWALAQQPNSPDFEYVQALMPYYHAIHKNGVNIDFINEKATLEKYKVVILPYKYILTQEYAEAIQLFVKNGGILVTTCRTGVKNINNVSHQLTLPGFLRDAVGIRIDEYESISKDEPYPIDMDGTAYQGSLLADWIITESAEVLGSFTQEDVDYPAVTKNVYGKGLVYYVGTIPCDVLAAKVIDIALNNAGIQPFDLPEHVEAFTRTKGATDYLFLINHTMQMQTISASGYDLLSEKQTQNSLMLEPNGVAVLRQTPSASESRAALLDDGQPSVFIG